jgi:low affinity Fe/Cu permease
MSGSTGLPRGSDGGSPSMASRFADISNRISTLAGSYKTFMLAIAVILVWAVSGPIFKFSNTWQLVINTGTTIITFLMVFLIQNTQNRDAAAVHLKLDELINALEAADDRVIAAESIPEEKMAEWKKHYAELSESQDTIEKDVKELRESLAKR